MCYFNKDNIVDAMPLVINAMKMNTLTHDWINKGYCYVIVFA